VRDTIASERDKMLRGELYMASDAELVAARLRARRLWQRYNASDPAADLLGPGVQLLAADRPRDSFERSRGLEFGRPIAIGANVWIGGAAIICPGVTIGDGSTIGAGSVVTRSVPAHVIAAGNPCRVIREV
jgi:NDP-sugar pyrophosphorylase family protein